MIRSYILLGSYTLLLLIFIAACQQPQSGNKTTSEEGKVIQYSGENIISEDIIIPEGSVLEILPGTQLKLNDKVNIIIEGKIIAKGTAEQPIVFESNGKGIYWRGIKINGLGDIPDIDKYWEWLEYGDKEVEDRFFDHIANGNIFEYCTFRNVAPDSREFERRNKWMGTVEAYNTAIKVSNCTFEDIMFFGAVLTQRSYVIVDHCLFDDVTMHKAINSTDRAVGLFYKNTIIGHRNCNARCADGIWTKKFVGLIAENHILDVADDGIDTDNSKVVIYRNKVQGVFDDGIDIDNGGLCFIIENEISGVNENGILVSDGSEAILIANKIDSSAFGLTLRDGAEVVSDRMDIQYNEYGVILYQNIPIALTHSDFESIRERISKMTVDEIYAAEFIDDVESPDDLISLIDHYYVKRKDMYIFEKAYFSEIKKLDPLKKTFKIVGVFDLETIENSETRLHPLNKALKNGLFLSAANVKNNTHDVTLYHDYNLKIEGTEFTSDESEKEIMDNCKCDENHKCAIIDKFNTSGVETNARKIIKRIESI